MLPFPASAFFLPMSGLAPPPAAGALPRFADALCCGAFCAAAACLFWRNAPPAWICDYHASPVEQALAFRRRRAFGGRLFLAAFLCFSGVPLLAPGIGPAGIFLLFCLFQLSLCDLAVRMLQDEWILLCGACSAFSGRPPAAADLAAACVFLLICLAVDLLVFSREDRQSPVGFGDVKLAAALCAACGLGAAVSIFLLASLLCGAAAAVLLLLKQKKKKDPIAFGPFVFLAVIFYFASVSAMAAASRSMLAV